MLVIVKPDQVSLSWRISSNFQQNPWLWINCTTTGVICMWAATTQSRFTDYQNVANAKVATGYRSLTEEQGPCDRTRACIVTVVQLLLHEGEK